MNFARLRDLIPMNPKRVTWTVLLAIALLGLSIPTATAAPPDKIVQDVWDKSPVKIQWCSGLGCALVYPFATATCIVQQGGDFRGCP